MRIQDYERVYAVPGLYEEIVQRRLGCRTPARMALLLAGAAARIGWEPAAVRILDAGAGNGVSGEAFAAQGMRPVVGLDILPAARDAALRDRPGVYGAYLAADLCALAPAEERVIRDAAPNALACVGSVGGGHLPAEAVAAALRAARPATPSWRTRTTSSWARIRCGICSATPSRSPASAPCTAARSRAASAIGRRWWSAWRAADPQAGVRMLPNFGVC